MLLKRVQYESKNDVMQLTDSQTKHKHLKIEQNKLLKDLKDTKKLHIAVQHYKTSEKLQTGSNNKIINKRSIQNMY